MDFFVNKWYILHNALKKLLRGLYNMQDEMKIIEKIRQEMIQSGLKYGIEDRKTILLSHKLDEALNRFELNKQKTKLLINQNEAFFYKS